MGFQSVVRADLASGVVGELAFEGPLRSQPSIITSPDATQNIVARAFTTVSEGVARAGGTGIFVGLLANPKVLPLYGTAAGGPLADSLQVPNGLVGEFVSMGIMFVSLPAAAAIGDEIIYNTTTGALSSQAPGATPGAGLARVPGATVYYRTVTAAGLAIVKLAN